MESKAVLLRKDWKSVVIRFWNPTSLARPVITDLGKQGPIQRATMVLWYSALRVEYWISPSGSLREWIRFNITLALIIGIPALLVVPIVTVLLWQFTAWTDYLVQIAKNFLLFPVIIIGAGAIITAFLCFLRVLLRK